MSLQLDALNHYEVDQIFEEKVSGKRKNRPQLNELLKVLRKGDTVVIYKLYRISRSTKHLIELMDIHHNLTYSQWFEITSFIV
ncbi:recombinase family protein [Paenibacillus xylanivorans]